jgi:hypothetical protein
VPILRDFERRLGGLVEGAFSKAFRSGLQPVELAKRILREQDDGKTVGIDEIWAPNRFVFALSPEDSARLEGAGPALVAELTRVVRDNAAERGWGLVGPPEIELTSDPSLRKGDLRCEASFEAAEEGDQPEVAPTSAGGASLVVHEEGATRTVPLAAGTTTIGRLPDCEVVLTDRGASRRHAQIETKEGVATLIDLGSTNGTRLNGQTVQRRALADGDRITIGTTSIEYRRG